MNTTLLVLLVVFLSSGLVATLIVYVRKNARLRSEASQQHEEINRLTVTYAPLINVDLEIQKRREAYDNLAQQIGDLQSNYINQKETLSSDYQNKKAIYESLLKEIAIVEDSLEDISYGLYEPHYDFATSERFKMELDAVRAKEKALIKAEEAVTCRMQWTVGGSREDGIKMTKLQSKLMLRAFNGECDAAIANVSWNNVTNMEARITKSFEAINKLGEVHQISIYPSYYRLKLDELRLTFELQEKLHQEKEEQRLIKEQMREEEKAQREIEIAQKKAADEEARYQKALEKARQDIKYATGKQMESLAGKIQELEGLLSAAHAQKERAMSMAQMTKSGHVYIISNIGSFGEDVYKIGMTRRLEPMDRVRELGDASVPFSFDVHALVYSDNAPELEHLIHKKLMDQRINLINNRREFFRVNIEQLETIFKEQGLELKLTRLAEAREYRESVSIRESKANQVLHEVIREVEMFPAAL